MRYFTRGWINGELTDDESERLLDSYRRHLEAIGPRLSLSARTLAHDVNLHDAVIEQVRWRPATKELLLMLVAGDLQSGYRAVSLTYVGALLGKRRIDTLGAAARDRETEVLYDEVDIGDDGLLVHRLIFAPRDEVTIDFGELRMQVTPRADRRVHLGGAFVEEHDSDDVPEANT